MEGELLYVRCSYTCCARFVCPVAPCALEAGLRGGPCQVVARRDSSLTTKSSEIQGKGGYCKMVHAILTWLEAAINSHPVLWDILWDFLFRFCAN